MGTHPILATLMLGAQEDALQATMELMTENFPGAFAG